MLHNQTITLHIIAKDEIGKLENIIEKYDKYFDAIHIAYDDDCVTKLKPNPKVTLFKYGLYKYEGLLDFADKRNFLVSQCKTDWYFRLDTDDEIENPEYIKEMLVWARETNLSIVTCYYDYSKDDWGNTNVAHYRETLIKNDNNTFWNKPIHENLLPRNLNIFKLAKDNNIKIKHNTDKKHSIESAERNIKYLIREYNKDRENTDPRTLSYLGRTLKGLGHFNEAVFFLQKHIEHSGWDDDRYLSWCDLAEIFKLQGENQKALSAAFEALGERPEFPDAYFSIHDIYFNQDKWEKAIEWALMGFSKPMPETNVFIDPSAYTWRPMLSLAHCYFEQGNFEKAYIIFKDAKKYVPNLDYIKDTEKLYEKAAKHFHYIKNLIELAKFVRQTDSKKLETLVESIPDEVQEHEFISRLRDEYLKPKTWGDKSVVIWCGQTSEEWNPDSIKTGIGGSEEAVIHLSKELSKLGYEVTVFNNCGDKEAIYEGVEYKNFIRFRNKDFYNILISWRQDVFQFNVQAKKKIIWLHDLPTNIDFGDRDVDRVDKYVVLSQYHASLLPKGIPKNKIFVSTNGLNPKDYEGLDSIKREPRRIIYASSYDRGLEELLSMWKDIKAEVPEAEIHIYYGWNMYDKFVKDELIKDNGFKNRMLELFKQEGVFEHGRIGHKQLLEEYSKASFLAYPCTYKGEINCLAISKAVATGCYLITNDFAVCGERNPHMVVPNDKFKDTLIACLREDRKSETDTKKYIQDNSWESVARDWSKNLFPLDMDIAVNARQDWTLAHFTKQDKIVDIGSNKGHIFDGWNRDNITSVDIDEYDIPNFVRSDASNLPFKDKEFDKALLAEIVEHTQDPIPVLSEARRVAKQVIITVPYEYEWNEVVQPFKSFDEEKQTTGKSGKDLALDGNPTAKSFYEADGLAHLYHQRYYTPETFRADLEKAGFTNIKITKIRWQEWAWLGAVCE